MKLRPYPEYKDSGVPWLGEVPKHWKLQRLKSRTRNVVSQITSIMPTDICIALENVESWTGLISGTENNTGFDSQVKRFRANDILFGKLRPYLAKVASPTVNGVCVGEFLVLRSADREIESGFIEWILRSKPLIDVVSSSTYGAKMPRAEWHVIGSLICAFPLHDEQTQIAHFLDWKTAQIDRFIDNKRRLIDLLKEQKQALINQAVIGAIDVRTGKPYPEYKESGVPWLGKAPAGWQILPIKRVVRFNPSKSETGDSPSVNKQVCFLPMERISEEGEINCSEKRQLSEVWEGFTYFRSGDVVLAKITPCFENGKGAYLSELETEYGFGTTELFVLRSTRKIHGAFLRFVTATKTFRWLGAQNMTGAAGQQRVPSSFVKNFQIGLPPLDEQEAIVSFIQRISKSIDTAITRTQREISLMREYRTRLIADVVTGKLDVRRVAVPSFEKSTRGDTDTKESEFPTCDQEAMA